MRIRTMTYTAAKKFIVLSVLLSTSATAGEKVLIRTAKPYDKLVAAIQQNGGTVTHQFKYVQGLAADIPAGAWVELPPCCRPAPSART